MKKQKLRFDSNKLYEMLTSSETVPIMTEYKPFNDLVKTDVPAKIKTMASQLNEVLREEKELLLTMKNMEKEKSKTTSRVLYFSSQLNSSDGNERDMRMLAEEEGKIHQANMKLDNMDKHLLKLREEKQKLNLGLLKETLENSYKNINADQNRLEEVNYEINELRKALDTLRAERDMLDNKVTTTYNFVHGLMGASATEKIDENFIQNNKK